MLLGGYDAQNYISNRLALPVDDVNDTSYVQSITGEVLQLYYFNSGVPTADAGQAAGTVVIGVLAYKNILDRMGVMVGNELETSVTFTTGTIFPAAKLKRCEYLEIGNPSNATLSEIAADVTANFANGEWCIDHRNGVIYGKKATTGTSDTVAYKVATKATGGGTSIATAVKVTDGTDIASVLARTTGAEIPAVTDDALVVYDVSGSSGVGGGGNTLYLFDSTNSLGMGQTAYTAATQVTVTGLSFTPNVQALVKIERYATGGAFVAEYTPQKNTITYSAGVYTVAGVTFTATDTFVIYQQGPERTTNLASNTQQTMEANPLNSQYVEEAAVDTTNVAAAATYYPSSLGMAMAGYKNFSITGKYIDGDAVATTLSVQGTNDSDTTNADWVNVQGQVQGITGTVTGTVAGVAGTAIVPGSVATQLSTALAQTMTFAWDFDNCNFRYIRILLTPGDATNTAIIYMRRSY